MSMNEEDKATFERWLSKKDFKGVCASCGASHWIVGELIASQAMDDHGASLGRPSISMAQLICENCSHLMLFSAAHIGIAPR